MTKPFVPRPGDLVSVRSVSGGYPLPAGLSAGDEVRLVCFDTGFWVVERDGRQFRVFLAGIKPPKP